MDTQILIRTSDNKRLFVDEFNGEQVWLSIVVMGASANCVMSKDEAEELIEALKKVIGELK